MQTEPFQLTKDELSKGLEYISNSSLMMKYLRYFGMFLAIIGTFGLYQYYVNNVTADFWSWFLPFFGLYLFFMPQINAYFQTNQLIKSGNHITELLTFSFDQEQYELKGENFSSQIQWKLLKKVVFKKGLVLLFLTDKTATILPERVLSHEQLEALKSLVVANKK